MAIHPGLSLRYTIDQKKGEKNNGIFERIRRSYTFSE